ncbi:MULTISPECIES: hypothetical protein [Nostoc]|uniref:Uncharacterized protein n=2 Tax=Nostoc TaxID=1177 RepID=A0ABR8I164_9NOSO|nr:MULTISPECIES: hypothetical protein [Nostoc]MBD2559804.1 hypothetical protein [Nostoc linckia FACHB-391]MBD2645232.1 hypothetical protein [Nostoc foliaceum FACHB-393]
MTIPSLRSRSVCLRHAARSLLVGYANASTLDLPFTLYCQQLASEVNK